MDSESLLKAAQEGAICARCGGFHVVDVTSGILLAEAEERRGKAIPICHCEGCELCRDFRQVIAEVIEDEHQL